MNRVLIIAPRGFAKAQSVDSKVLTPTGWKRMGEIAVGDLVIGEDGTSKKVIGETSVTEMDLFRITTRDGRATLCNEDHLWGVTCPSNTGNRRIILPLRAIKKNFKCERLDKRTGVSYVEYRYFLDWSLPIQFSKKEFALDPYTLGAWLGDGTSVDGGFTTADTEILGFFPYETRKRKAKYYYTILKIRPILRSIGVLGNKHIPEAYLFGSKDQRTSLLQGLIDTDGSVVKGGGIIEFTNTNKRLIDDVICLIRGLGGTASLGSGEVRLNGKEFHYWKITARLPKEICPVRLNRKKTLWKGSIKTKSAIVDIRYEKKGPGKCLMVEGDYYITDDFLLTHNSTICSVFLPLWLALFQKKRDIIIVSATISLAMEQLRKIRIECETNTRIINDFGDVRSEKWTEDMLVFKNGTVIRAKGRGFQIRGFRPDMIINDDLEDDEVVSSKDQREKLQEWFFRTLLPSLKPNQPLLYIGTKLHQFSLISMLEKREEFVSRTYRALDEDGRSIWEDYFPTETLMRLKHDLGTYAFQSEFMNNPISGKEQPIKPEYLKDVKVGGKASYACLAIDPAISEKESADYRAFSLFERTEHGFREVFSEHGRWGIEEQVQRIIDIYKRYEKNYQYLRVLIEEVAFQKVFSHILTETSRKQGIFIPVSRAELGVGPNKRPRDKMTRLLSVSHLFEQRIVEVKNPELVEELLEFPHGDYDDLLDSTVFALYWLMNFRKGAAIMKSAPDTVVEAKKSYYMKEIRPGVFVGTYDDAVSAKVPPKGIINYDRA